MNGWAGMAKFHTGIGKKTLFYMQPMLQPEEIFTVGGEFINVKPYAKGIAATC